MQYCRHPGSSPLQSIAQPPPRRYKGLRDTPVRVYKPAVKDPIAVQKAVAIYTELNERHVQIPIVDTYKGAIDGPVTVQYFETFEDGVQKLAETQAVLR